ncbi:MAG: hypothetical protein P8186_00280 [Anaerolineae bacterium]|jgi:hypothetical protein
MSRIGLYYTYQKFVVMELFVLPGGEVGRVDGRWAVAGVLARTKSFLEERPVYLREVFEGEV